MVSPDASWIGARSAYPLALERLHRQAPDGLDLRLARLPRGLAKLLAQADVEDRAERNLRRRVWRQPQRALRPGRKAALRRYWRCAIARASQGAVRHGRRVVTARRAPRGAAPSRIRRHGAEQDAPQPPGIRGDH